MDVYKTSSQTGEPLAKACFGLYNKQGGLISTDETDENGYLRFETDIQNGIVLRDHELYYMQELKAPSGYRLDDTKHWFCFCSTKEPSCDTCQERMDEAGVTALRIPFDQIGRVDFENEILDYDLPATGSRGLYPFVVLSVTFILTPLTYLFILRRKRNRRDET